MEYFVTHNYYKIIAVAVKLNGVVLLDIDSSSNAFFLYVDALLAGQ